MLISDTDKGEMSLNDFYTYVNKSWLKNHSIPADDTSYSLFDQVEEKIRTELIAILQKERRLDTPLGRFVESFYTGRKQDLQIVQEFCHHVLDQDSIIKKFALLNLYGLESPIDVGISYDQRNTEQCIVYISPPNLGILKSDFEEDGEVSSKYRSYLTKLGKLIQVDGFAQSVFDVEKRLSKFYFDPQDSGKSELLYNPKTLDQLESAYPNLQFRNFFSFLHIDERYVRNLVIVSNPTYFEQLNELVKNHSENYLDKWIQCLIFSSFMELLPNPYKSLHFEFFVSFLRGQHQQHTKDHQLVRICDELVQDTLGKRYVEENLSTFLKIQKAAIHMYSLINKAARKRIHKLNWLSEDSRKIADFKLQKMKAKIAFPQFWVNEFEGVAIDRDTFMMNVLSLSQKQVMYDIQKLSGLDKKDRAIWGNSCYEVNAYYYAELNELSVPMGFLQAPFFSLHQNFIENLAGLGNVIAHEISHGFDEEGRKFDEKGNNFPWWTATDIELYKNRTRALINEFDKQTVKGVQINGELTLGENLADFGALAMCLDVLKDIWKEKNTSPEVQKKDLRDFFTAYARSWAYKNTAAARLQASKSDTHAPPMLRVNVVLRHFQEFYDAFGFTEADEGWISLDHRIDVWGT